LRPSSLRQLLGKPRVCMCGASGAIFTPQARPVRIRGRISCSPRGAVVTFRGDICFLRPGFKVSEWLFLILTRPMINTLYSAFCESCVVEVSASPGTLKMKCRFVWPCGRPRLRRPPLTKKSALAQNSGSCSAALSKRPSSLDHPLKLPRAKRLINTCKAANAPFKI
jgi:hypothetical protein